ncbi:hypothetical protein [Sphingomonas sp. PB4P5]|uniref:hypothetical protein n=1 Tax=Parasphingomonas puruogangriensis TaxID=3096155 RepID=UPI002FC6A1CA
MHRSGDSLALGGQLIRSGDTARWLGNFEGQPMQGDGKLLDASSLGDVRGLRHRTCSVTIRILDSQELFGNCRLMTGKTSMQAVALPIVDFPMGHPAMARMLAVIGRTKVFSVPRMPQGRSGMCYWNAERSAARNGGRLELGWMLEWYPGVYVLATHHGVLKRGNFRVDVTPPMNGRTASGSTTFVPDDRYPVDLRWPVKKENLYLPLVEDADVDEAHAAYRANNRLLNESDAEIQRFPGSSWSPETGWRAPAGFAFSRDFNPEVSATYNQLHAARARLLARYGT